MNHKIASALFGVFAFAFSHNAMPAHLSTLRIASNGGLNHLPLFMAQKQGFFTKHGVRVELIQNAPAGPTAIRKRH